MRLIRLNSCSLAPMPCSEYLSRDAPELHGLCEIPDSLQLSAAVPNSRFHVFLFEQTAALIPDLFRALPGLEYIADQPGPRGRAFRPEAVRGSGLKSVPRQARSAAFLARRRHQ